MILKNIINFLEQLAPPSLQESYDNAGLLTGTKDWECNGILISLDCVEGVVAEAVRKGCNMIVCHHPIIFKGLKRINGNNYVERTIIAAIKNDIAIYATHTNLDNVMSGVNGKIAETIGLKNLSILNPRSGDLRKLTVFVPHEGREKLLKAIFAAGAGSIGNYSQVSFSGNGTGSFIPGEGSNPAIGEQFKKEIVEESRVEVIYQAWQEAGILKAMTENHPYETVAYDVYKLENANDETGSGMIGKLDRPMLVKEFLQHLKTAFNVPFLKYTESDQQTIQKVAVCGGAGSFLIPAAMKAGADIYVTSDVKYHEFFDGESKMMIVDIGHYETEQFTIDLLYDILSKKYTNFAVLKTEVNTNPVHYFG